MRKSNSSLSLPAKPFNSDLAHRRSRYAGKDQVSQIQMNTLKRVIEQSIKLESNASELYTLFYQTFEEDKAFWWDLRKEEENHAVFLESAKNIFEDSNGFPRELICDSLQSLINANKDLRMMIDNFRSNPPSRETAFNAALKVEMSVGEIHFQNAMHQPNESEILKAIQQLNNDDEDHARRIRTYMNANGVKLIETS